MSIPGLGLNTNQQPSLSYLLLADTCREVYLYRFVFRIAHTGMRIRNPRLGCARSRISL